MDTNEFVTQAGDRARRAAERAEMSPMELLRGGFEGKSGGGRVTAWVNAFGQLQRVHIQPGSFLAGDEEQVARAVVEAAADALRAATTVTVPPEVQARLAELEAEAAAAASARPITPQPPPTPMSQPPARPRRRPDPDEEDTGWGGLQNV